MTEQRRLKYALESLPDLLGPSDLALLYEALQFKDYGGADEGLILRLKCVEIIRERKRLDEYNRTLSYVPFPGIQEPVGFIDQATLDNLRQYGGLYRIASPKWKAEGQHNHLTIPLYTKPETSSP